MGLLFALVPGDHQNVEVRVSAVLGMSETGDRLGHG